MAGTLRLKYLPLTAAGHALLIEAARVDRIADRPDGAVLDLSLRFGARAPGCVAVICLKGPALMVDAVGTLLDLADEALMPVPWLPVAAAAFVDAVGAGRWRLRAELPE